MTGTMERSWQGRGRRAACASFVGTVLALAFLSTLLGHPAPAHAFQPGGQLASTVIGQANFTSDVSGLAPNTLDKPFRQAFDAEGNLWVADENNHRVVEFKAPLTDGESAYLEIGQPDFATSHTNASRSSLSGPVGIAFDRSGDLWVADFVDNRITEYVPPFTSGMNASLELGQPAGGQQFLSHGAQEPRDGLSAPLDVAFDSKGDLWVTDRLNNRVVEYVPPFANGASPALAVGQKTISAGSAGTTRDGLSGPQGIAFDSSGNLWVADENNNRILEFGVASLKASGPQAALEIGQPAGANEFLTNYSSLSRSGFTYPIGVAFDPAGDLLVSDRANNRVLGFEPPFSDGMNASFVIGQPDGQQAFTTNVVSLSQDSVQNPLGVTVDQAGNLWVADELHDRVLEFSGTAVATAAVDALLPSGSYSADQTGSTGLIISVDGALPGSEANIYSADLASPPRGVPAFPFGAVIGYYEAKVSGATGGSSSICIANDRVASSTSMGFYVGSSWVEAPHPAIQGTTVCDAAPASGLGSALLIGLGGGQQAAGGSSATIPSIAVASVAVGVAIIALGGAYVALRRRRRMRR